MWAGRALRYATLASVGLASFTASCLVKERLYSISAEISEDELPPPESGSYVPDEWLPVEQAPMTMFPEVPPPIQRRHPVRLVLHMTSMVQEMMVSPNRKMEVWTFNGTVPGPFIRARQGDVLEVHHTNVDRDGVAHNIDFHAVTGPGGGAPYLLAEQNETRTGTFRLMHPGLFVYHCAAGPVPVHIARGMYGLLLVEPFDGLPNVDKEFAVMQSEIYGSEVKGTTDLEFDYTKGLIEQPTYVVFNGAEGTLTKNPIVVNQGERVRLFVGNAGPNLISSLHLIGTIFDRVYRDGDLISPPARALQIAMIPAGGSSIVEFDALVPGNYTLIDHSIFRIEKGAIGFVKVIGKDAKKDIFSGGSPPIQCPGCKLHN